MGLQGINAVTDIEEVVLAVEHPDEAVAMFEALCGLQFKESWTVPADHMSVKCARVGAAEFHVVSSTRLMQ